MKSVIISLVFILAFVTKALAVAPTVTISGTLSGQNNQTITFLNSYAQTPDGNPADTIYPQQWTTPTNGSGVMNAITLPQGLVVLITPGTMQTCQATLPSTGTATITSILNNCVVIGVTLANINATLASPPPIGSGTPNSIAGTTGTFSGALSALSAAITNLLTAGSASITNNLSAATVTPGSVAWNSGTDVSETNAPRSVCSTYANGTLGGTGGSYGNCEWSVPVTIREVHIFTQTAPTGCSTSPIMDIALNAVDQGSTGRITLTNLGFDYGTSGFSLNVPANTIVTSWINTAGVGCGNSPQNIMFNYVYTTN